MDGQLRGDRPMAIRGVRTPAPSAQSVAMLTIHAIILAQDRRREQGPVSRGTVARRSSRATC